MSSEGLAESAALFLSSIPVSSESCATNLCTPRSTVCSSDLVIAIEKDRSIASWPVSGCTIDGMGMRLSCCCGCAAARAASRETALTTSSVRIVTIECNIVIREFVDLPSEPWPWSPLTLFLMRKSELALQLDVIGRTPDQNSKVTRLGGPISFLNVIEGKRPAIEFEG